MSQIDIAHLRTWIGKTLVDEDDIALRHARLMAATVDLPEFIAPPILTIFITSPLLFPKIRTALSF